MMKAGYNVNESKKVKLKGASHKTASIKLKREEIRDIFVLSLEKSVIKV